MGTLPVKTTHPLTPTTDALGTPANATGSLLLDSDYTTGGGTSTSTPDGDPSTGWPTASQGPVTTDKMPAAEKYTTTIFCLKSVASIPMVTTVLLLLVTVSPQAALLCPRCINLGYRFLTCHKWNIIIFVRSMVRCLMSQSFCPLFHVFQTFGFTKTTKLTEKQPFCLEFFFIMTSF